MKTRTIHILAVLLSLLGSLAHAAPLGTAFTYQGKLFSGANAANGTYDFQFALYDARAGGNLLAGPIANPAQPVAGGLFTVTLDFGANLFTGEARWLEIGVRINGNGAFHILPPRQALTPTPYALYAPSAAVAASAQTVANNAVSGTGIAPGQVVKSHNGLKDDLVLAAGANVALGTNGNTLQISAGTNAGSIALPAGYRENGLFTSAPVASGNNAIAQGEHAQALGNNSVVGGGLDNMASHWFATVGGGWSNWAGGFFFGRTTISGGEMNQATGDWSTVGGGQLNTAAGLVWGRTTVGGGWQNSALGDMSTVSGGSSNLANNTYGTVGGGGANAAGGTSSTVAGGYLNTALGLDSSIGGGSVNGATNAYATVGGGRLNLASGISATVAGGFQNTASGRDTSIGGGYLNVASGLGSTVSGGYNNQALGDYSFAAGQSAVASAPGSTVFADSQPRSFASSLANEFAVRAAGGVRVESGVGIHLEADDGPMIVRDWDPFSATAPNGKANLGRWGLFMEANALVLGVPALDVGYKFMEVARYNPDGTREKVFGVGNDGVTTVKVLTITGGSDLAEPFAVSGAEPAPKGSVLVIDDENPGRLRLSTRPYDKRVAGVISGAGGLNPGLTIAQQGVTDQGAPVALSGRVYTLADAGNGPIQPGDLLTTSAVPGYAMKVTDHARSQGAVIGKAMMSLKEGRGLVLVLVSLQ